MATHAVEEAEEAVAVETIEDARRPTTHPLYYFFLNGLKRGVMSSCKGDIFLTLPPLKC